MASTYWNGRDVLVTGASGFIGSHLTELLVGKGAKVTAAVSLTRNRDHLVNLQTVRDKIRLIRVDLTRFEDCMAGCRHQEIVLNAAYLDGNVAFKQNRPAYIFRQNMLSTLNMLEAARLNGVERFLTISSAEVYAPDVMVPTPESEGFKGLPARLTDGYAWSKRMSELAAELFAREYGLKVAIARLNNVYGPRDHFDTGKGRVIPMFINKVFQGEETITIWGTGEQIRSFLYVEDLAYGLLDLVEKYPECDPVNFSGKEEITIKALARLIVKLSGKPVKIVCDPDKPSGPLNRAIDTRKARQFLGFTESVPLEIGLQRAIESYKHQCLSQKIKSDLALPSYMSS